MGTPRYSWGDFFIYNWSKPGKKGRRNKRDTNVRFLYIIETIQCKFSSERNKSCRATASLVWYWLFRGESCSLEEQTAGGQREKQSPGWASASAASGGETELKIAAVFLTAQIFAVCSAARMVSVLRFANTCTWPWCSSGQVSSSRVLFTARYF